MLGLGARWQELEAYISGRGLLTGVELAFVDIIYYLFIIYYGINLKIKKWEKNKERIKERKNRESASGQRPKDGKRKKTEIRREWRHRMKTVKPVWIKHEPDAKQRLKLQ